MKKRLISLLLAFSMMLTFLPAGAVSAFAEDPNKPLSGNCGVENHQLSDNITWKLIPANAGAAETTYTLDLKGTGELLGSYPGNPTWNWASEQITQINLPEGVTSISYHNFSFCGQLRSIVIPNTVLKIGDFAFQRSGLEDITIPSSVLSIGQFSFNDCESLKRVTIENGLEKIGFGAFEGCTNLREIYLPVTVPEIASTVTRECGTKDDHVKIYYPGTKNDWLAQFAVVNNKVVDLQDSKTEIRNGVWYNYDGDHPTEDFTIPICYYIDVAFDANGGKFSGGASTATVSNVYRTENVDANKVPVPTRSGHQLAGWCTDPDDAENTMVDPTDIKPTESNVYGGVSDDLKLYAVWKAIPDHELTVKNGTFTYDNNAASDKGNVYEGALVTVTLDENNQLWKDSNLSFDHWDIQSEAKLLDENGEEIVNPGKTFTFVMPKEGVTIEAMPKENAVEDDGSDVLGTVAVIGTAAVGTAVLGYQAYCLGAEFAGKLLDLPYFPSNRSALALMLWEDAGKPMPESELLYPDVGQEEQDMDLQHAARWAMENELIPDLNDEGTAAEEMKFYPNNAVSKIKVLKAWQKAQELKQNA